MPNMERDGGDPMSLYTDLVRQRVVGDPEARLGAELLGRYLAARARLDGLAPDATADWRLAALLEYDTALVLLCRALGLPDPDGIDVEAGDGGRRRAEKAVAVRLPGLAQ